MRALRAGEHAAANRPPALPDGTGSGRLPRTTTTETLDQLRIALAAERAVWIGYADPAGVTTERVVEPLRLEGGFLTGYDLRTAQVRTFTIARITAVAAVATLSPAPPDATTPPGVSTGSTTEELDHRGTGSGQAVLPHGEFLEHVGDRLDAEPGAGGHGDAALDEHERLGDVLGEEPVGRTVSPGRVNPGSDASAMFAARPSPVSTMPPHHTGTPRARQRSWIALASR